MTGDEDRRRRERGVGKTPADEARVLLDRMRLGEITARQIKLMSSLGISEAAEIAFPTKKRDKVQFVECTYTFEQRRQMSLWMNGIRKNLKNLRKIGLEPLHYAILEVFLGFTMRLPPQFHSRLLAAYEADWASYRQEGLTQHQIVEYFRIMSDTVWGAFRENQFEEAESFAFANIRSLLYQSCRALLATRPNMGGWRDVVTFFHEGGITYPEEFPNLVNRALQRWATTPHADLGKP